MGMAELVVNSILVGIIVVALIRASYLMYITNSLQKDIKEWTDDYEQAISEGNFDKAHQIVYHPVEGYRKWKRTQGKS